MTRRSGRNTISSEQIGRTAPNSRRHPTGGGQGGIDLEDLFRRGGHQGGTTFSDFFEILFGGMGGGGFGTGTSTGPGGRARSSGRSSRTDAETELSLPLEEMHRGTTRTLTVRMGNAEKKIDVRIPPGARNDSQIRIPGGSTNGGDLYVRLRQEPNSQFTVNGDDTETEVTITPWEAALGGNVEVLTLDGRTEIRIPAGIASGQRMRLANRGLNVRGGGARRSLCTVEDRRAQATERCRTKVVRGIGAGLTLQTA